MQAQKTNHPEVFLFINSGSGGGVGKELLASNVPQLKFEVPPSQLQIDKDKRITVTIHLYNMNEQNNRREGFQKLKSDVDRGIKVILVICGGDGTVMWVVSEMTSFQIDHLKVPIAMIPLGTGNDFSRVLGWGKQSPDILDNDFAKLKKRVTYWLSAHQEPLDIWMIEAEAEEYGKLEKVQDLQPKTLETKTIKKHFCNYFSIGVDGKIGFSFDMHRTSTRMGNLAMYGVMGLVKSFTRTKSLEQLTLEFKQLQSVPIAQTEVNLEVPNEPNRQSTVRESIILHHQAESMKEYKDNQNLLVMNINSFMGGIQDIWANAKLPSHLKDNKFTIQSHSDGKLQIISFGGPLSLGFQKAMGGQSTKVYQGSGPFEFSFNKFPQNEKHRTYLQIDGQFIRFTHPKRLLIERSNLSATGQIKILRRVPLEIQKGCCGCS